MYLHCALFCSTLKAFKHGSHSFICNYTNACLYLVRVHQMAPPKTYLANVAVYYSSIWPEWMKGYVGMVGWPTADGTKWSPVSYRLSAGQGKFACQRQTFYHCTTYHATNQISCILNWHNSLPVEFMLMKLETVVVSMSSAGCYGRTHQQHMLIYIKLTSACCELYYGEWGVI